MFQGICVKRESCCFRVSVLNENQAQYEMYKYVAFINHGVLSLLVMKLFVVN